MIPLSDQIKANFTLKDWLGPRSETLGSSNQESYWWNMYCHFSQQTKRFPRLVIVMLIYFTFFLALQVILGRPFDPARGIWSLSFDTGLLGGAVIAYTYLLVFVLDANVMANTLIRRLSFYIGDDKTGLQDNRTVYLINEVANVVSGLLFFPFSALFMMIVSRNRLFAPWDWPPILIGTFFSGLALIIWAAILLQQSASKAKRLSIAYLDREIAVRLKSPDRSTVTSTLRTPEQERSEVEAYREVRTQINGFSGIAVLPWYQNPLFRAILIPLGGVGSLKLLEQFAPHL